MGRRYGGWAVLLVGALVAVAGCSGGSGSTVSTTASTTAPTPTATATTTATTTAKATTTRKATTAATTTTPKPTPTIAIPKVKASAQPAVDAYIEYLRAAYLVEANPAAIRRGDMNMLLGSRALKAINASLDALGQAGIGYTGTPPDPRVQVVIVASSKLVILTTCPLQSKTDPYRQIVLATGKPVKVADRSPPPPYLRTLTMFHNKKRWVLIHYKDDTSRTCTG